MNGSEAKLRCCVSVHSYCIPTPGAFGMWKVEAVTFDDRTFKKYKGMREYFEVEDIEIRQLSGVSPLHRFPDRVLRELAP